MIDGSYDGTHKLSIDFSGLIYDWNNDWWWKPSVKISVKKKKTISNFSSIMSCLISVILLVENNYKIALKEHDAQMVLVSSNLIKKKSEYFSKEIIDHIWITHI